MAISSRFAVFRNLYLALAALVVVLTTAIIGYVIIEGYSIVESFYMAVITLSTVGFKEVRPLSTEGQVFTAFLIITSFGIFAYAVSIISRSFFNGEFNYYYKVYRLQNQVKKFSDHVIICGFGRNGRRTAKKLKAYNQQFVVIENDEETIDRYLKNGDVPYINADATSDEALIEAGIVRAKSLVSTLSQDADNLYAVITARELNTTITIISRASNIGAERKLKAVGANHVVMPEGVGGAHMATLVVSPNIVEFLDYLSVEGSSSINLEEIEVSQVTDKMEALQLQDLAIRQKTGCTIIGLKNPDGEYVINPAADLRISHNARLFVLGNPEEIATLNKMLNDA
jgi:voltage-gated potassium channel